MKQKTDVTTISDTSKLIEGSGRASVLLCEGIILHIKNALQSSKSNINILSFKDFCLNGYHIETKDDEDIEYLCITQQNLDRKCVMENLPTFPWACTTLILVQLKQMPL